MLKKTLIQALIISKNATSLDYLLNTSWKHKFRATNTQFHKAALQELMMEVQWLVFRVLLSMNISIYKTVIENGALASVIPMLYCDGILSVKSQRVDRFVFPQLILLLKLHWNY